MGTERGVWTRKKVARIILEGGFKSRGLFRELLVVLYVSEMGFPLICKGSFWQAAMALITLSGLCGAEEGSIEPTAS